MPRNGLVMIAVAAALGVLPSHARASDWTALDTGFELGLVALTATDVAQTRWFLSHRSDAIETNPVLGRHPSGDKVAVLAGTAMASHALIAAVLRQPYRRLWQVLAIGFEVDAVRSNARTFGFNVQF